MSFKNFKDIVDELLVSDILFKNKKTYFIKRYGFDNGTQKTLEEIGQKFNCTRENIRLHLKIAINNAYSYIFNKSDLFKDIADTIKEHIFIEKSNIFKIISNVNNEFISDKDKPYVYLLLDLLDVKEKYKYLYIHQGNRPGFDQCLNIRNNIISLLNNQPKNYTLPKIRDLLHKDLGLNILKAIIKDISSIEECKSETTAILYCIPIEKLKFNESLIYKVLYEHGSKMTKQDIFKEIKIRTKKKVVNFIINNSQYIDTIGKTGYWVLKEWHLDTNIIVNFIINVFKSINNTPTQMKDLCILVKNSRPDILDTTIKSYVYNTYRYMFNLKDNKISVKQKYLK